MYSCLLSCLFLSLVSSYNIDVDSPYVIRDTQSNSYFGFSTALHKWTEDNKKYILVGAPRSNWTSGSIASPGAVYKCELAADVGDPTSEQECSNQITYLTNNNAANSADEDKANQWLGVNVQSTDDFVSACAHRYTMLGGESGNKEKRVPIGKCTIIGGSLDGGDSVVKKVLYPCKSDSINLDSNSCQVGGSQTQTKVSDSAYLFYGAPGADIWEGSAFLSVNLDDVQGSKRIDKIDPSSYDFNQYNGYSTAICSMRGLDNPIDFITGAPKATNYKGRLYFFNSNNADTNEKFLMKNSHLNDDIEGDQMGAYFGYSLACADLNNDGYDDLLVGAPWYSEIASSQSSIISVGRVYVYNGHAEKVVSNPSKPVVLTAPSQTTSAFGLAIAHIGDINKDGFQDFAIGAPYQNDYKGVLYIYHGSINGIKTTPAQVIDPSNFQNSLGANLRTFGWSLSGDKDMDDNGYPDLAVGSYSADRVVYLRSLPIVDLDIQIKIPTTPVDLTNRDQVLDGKKFPGTTLKICFTPITTSIASKEYSISYTTFLDYKQSYAPRAYFQKSLTSEKEFSKSEIIKINTASSNEICTDEWTVFLNADMFDLKSYIEVNMTASLVKSSTFAQRAVLKQEQVVRAKGKIVIKSICESESGICQCDIKLHKPSVTYYPEGYQSIVLDNVNQVIVKYEVENLGPENAHLPSLKMKLPPKVFFIRRTPVDDQSETDVSPIACSEIEEDGVNYVECFLQDPLEVNEISKFGISLDTTSLTDTDPITLDAQVSVGSPSEEDNTANNQEILTLEVGRQANLDIRGTSATEKNVLKQDPLLLQNDAFLRSIKMEVRHTVSVLIDESESTDTEESGITDIVVQISWPLRTAAGKYLLYLSEVYVKDNQIKDNFNVNSPLIDPDCLFEYNTDRDCSKDPESAASTTVSVDEGAVSSDEDAPPKQSAELNTNCANGDPGCVKFNVTINLLKSGSINMKDLAFEMRSIIWLPTIDGMGDFNVTSTAEVVSVGQGLVIPPGSDVSMKTQIVWETSKQKNILWIIIGSVIGGLIILAILVFVLWKVGFFKRKMPPKEGF